MHGRCRADMAYTRVSSEEQVRLPIAIGMVPVSPDACRTIAHAVALALQSAHDHSRMPPAGQALDWPTSHVNTMESTWPAHPPALFSGLCFGCVYKHVRASCGGLLVVATRDSITCLKQVSVHVWLRENVPRW